MEPHVKLWIEHNGRLAMGDYRLQILELIEADGSLAGAAERLNLSYRRAWGKVKEVESNRGRPLVISRVGGAGGGRTELTPEGRALLERYRTFQRRAGAAVNDIFRETFGEPAPGESPP